MNMNEAKPDDVPSMTDMKGRVIYEEGDVMYTGGNLYVVEDGRFIPIEKQHRKSSEA